MLTITHWVAFAKRTIPSAWWVEYKKIRLKNTKNMNIKNGIRIFSAKFSEYRRFRKSCHALALNVKELQVTPPPNWWNVSWEREFPLIFINYPPSSGSAFGAVVNRTPPHPADFRWQSPRIIHTI